MPSLCFSDSYNKVHFVSNCLFSAFQVEGINGKIGQNEMGCVGSPQVARWPGPDESGFFLPNLIIDKLTNDAELEVSRRVR